MPPFRDLILDDRADADTPVLALEFPRAAAHLTWRVIDPARGREDYYARRF